MLRQRGFDTLPAHVKRDSDVLSVFNADGERHAIEVYVQPRRDWFISKFFHRVVEPIAYALVQSRVGQRVENILSARHEAECDGCCVDIVSDSSCCWMPMCVRLDLKCYDLDMRHRKVVAHFEIDDDIYNALGLDY